MLNHNTSQQVSKYISFETNVQNCHITMPHCIVDISARYEYFLIVIKVFSFMPPSLIFFFSISSTLKEEGIARGGEIPISLVYEVGILQIQATNGAVCCPVYKQWLCFHQSWGLSNRTLHIIISDLFVFLWGFQGPRHFITSPLQQLSLLLISRNIQQSGRSHPRIN